MGQALPLPERIPIPNNELKDAMLSDGIELNLSETDEYITYKLPKGWRMVNDSFRMDLPNYHIIDDNNIIRYSVIGAWKGTYDNKIEVIKGDGNLYINKKQTIIPSETDAEHVIPKIISAFENNDNN